MLENEIDLIPQVIEFTGEFGAEVNSFIPFVYWLAQAGHMAGRKVLTYQNMRPYYYFLNDDQYQEKAKTRHYVIPTARPKWLPNTNDHRSIRKPYEWFPDYRSIYNGELTFTKPILVVHNKFTSEWDGPPINYFSTSLLRTIFKKFHEEFQIIYFPANVTRSQKYGLVPDHQSSLDLDEQSALVDYPNVLTIDDLLDKALGKESFNSLKLKVFSNCHRFFIVQGGNVHLASLFPGSVIVVLHRRGAEIEHSYAAGHFQYASNPRPALLVCRDETDFLVGTDAVQNVRVVGGQAWLDPKGLDLLERFGSHLLRKPVQNIVRPSAIERPKEAPQTDLASALKGRTFAFGRVDGSLICNVVLNPDGSISGPRSPNERSWAIQDSKLVFLNEAGNVTTIFHEAYHNGTVYNFTGHFLPEGPRPWHSLTEIPRGYTDGPHD